MPNGIQAYGDYNQSTSGYRVLQPRPLDVYLGPWESIGTGNTAGTTSGGVSLANSIISGGVRYQGLQVIIIANSNPGQVGGQTLAYKYWYRGGTADSNLVEFASDAAGTPFDSSVSYSWTAPQYFSAGFSAAGGVTFTSLAQFTAGLSASGATVSGRLDVGGVLDVVGGVTLESTLDVGGTARFVVGLSAASIYASTGSTFGGTVQVNGGFSAGSTSTFGGLATFNGGLSAAGATLGRLVVNGGISASGGLTLGGGVWAPGGISAASLSQLGSLFVNGTISGAGGLDVSGSAGATLSTLVVNSGATVSGRLDVGGVLDVVGGVTLESTLDVVGAARFAAGLSAASVYASQGSTFASTVQVNGGFSAGSTSTFGGLATFNGGLSAAGATLGTLVVNSGATVGGRLDVGGILDVVGGVTLETTLDVVGAARFAGGLSAARIYASQGSTFAGPVTFAGITATRVDTGTLATTGQATLNSLDVTNDATVGATLTVNGNFYVQGTLTTFNETQLLIQDKYLVLGSTLNTSSLADGAGVYVGATVGANAIAGICYSNGSSEWSSSHSFDIPATSFYRVGGTNVLASNYLGSAVTGSSLASVGTLTNGVWNASTIGLTYGGTNKDLSATGVSGGIVFKDGSGLSVLSDTGASGNILRSNGTNAAPSWTSPSTLTGVTADKVAINFTGSVSTPYRLLMTIVQTDVNVYDIPRHSSGITYNPSTNTLSCTQIEAIVDGGTW